MFDCLIFLGITDQYALFLQLQSFESRKRVWGQHSVLNFYMNVYDYVYAFCV